MVKVKYYAGANKSLESYYSDAIEVTQSSKHKAVYTDPLYATKMIIEGEKLKFKDGDLVSGTVDKVTFKDAEGLTMATIKGEYKNFADFDQFFGSGFGEGYLFTGSDTIIGSRFADNLQGGSGKDKISGRGGEDFISSGQGKDELTGGADSDTFFFYSGFGHDVITDFDAIGLDGEQDYLQCVDPVSIEQSGKNTVLTFESGDTVTLLGVKATDVTDADILTIGG